MVSKMDPVKGHIKSEDGCKSPSSNYQDKSFYIDLCGLQLDVLYTSDYSADKFKL